MANQFQMAANLLRDAAIRSGTPWFYANPILYLYRHTIELSESDCSSIQANP
jgi:hypothetical protein